MWRRGTRSPFFQFSNTQRCPFRRSLASLGLSAWLVSVFFDRRHSRRFWDVWVVVLRGWMLGQVAASIHWLVLRFSQCCQVDTGERASERVLREAGERLERESLCECITLYNRSRPTPIFHTVLNYSTTGTRSRVVVREFCGMQGFVVPWSLQLKNPPHRGEPNVQVVFSPLKLNTWIS